MKLVEHLHHVKQSVVIILQHMPEIFLQNFTKTLQGQTLVPVHLVQESAFLSPGTIYVCGATMVLQSQTMQLTRAQDQGFYNPDIDTLLTSCKDIAPLYSMMVVILTGIGADGAKGASLLAKAGARVLTEDERSIVDGMPSAVRNSVESAEVCSLEQIAAKIEAFCV